MQNKTDKKNRLGKTEETTEKENILIPALLVTSVSLFPTMVLYSRNTGTIPLHYVLPFLLIFAALGWCVYGCCRLLLPRCKAALLAASAMCIFLNFGMLDRLFPQIADPDHLVYFLCAGVCLILAMLWFLVLKRLRKETAQILCTAFAVTFFGLTVFNGAVSAVTAAEGINRSRQIPTNQEQELLSAFEEAEPGQLPNFYLFITDEYAGPTELEEYYHFDNSSFYDALQDRGFQLSYDSTNYLVQTYYCLADLFNLQHLYYQDDTPAEVLLDRIRSGIFFRGLQDLGYDMYDAERYDMTGFTNLVPELYSVNAPATETGDTYIEVFLGDTAAFPLADNLEKAIYHKQTRRPDDMLKIINYYSTQQLPQDPSFHFIYICCPHGPFYFDAQGNRIDTKDDSYGNYNWTDKSVYLGQLQYVNQCILDVADNILEQDPNCILLVMSDHGARAHGEYGNADLPRDLADNILVALYNQGRASDWLPGQSGVNILRSLLNETYDMNLPMIAYEDDSADAASDSDGNASAHESDKAERSGSEG